MKVELISVLGLSAVPGLGFRTMNVGGHEVYPFRTRSGLAPSRVVEVEAPHATDPTVRSTYETDHGDVDMLVQPDQRLRWMLDGEFRASADGGCLHVDQAREIALTASADLPGDWRILESTRGAGDELHAGLCFDVRFDRDARWEAGCCIPIRVAGSPSRRR